MPPARHRPLFGGLSPTVAGLTAKSQYPPRPRTDGFHALIEHHYASADRDTRRILGWVSHVLDVLIEEPDRAACAAVLRDTIHATWPALRSRHVVESLDAALALCAPVGQTIAWSCPKTYGSSSPSPPWGP